MARTGNIYAGLVFPIGVALMTVVVGTLLLEERHTHRIWDEVDETVVVPEPSAGPPAGP